MAEATLMHRFKAMGIAPRTHEAVCGRIVSSVDTTLSWPDTTCPECPIAQRNERAYLLDVCRRTANLDGVCKAMNLPRELCDLILTARTLYTEVSRTDSKDQKGTE